jgi:replicative DNA helicase
MAKRAQKIDPPSIEYSKLPPQAIELEEAVLSAIIIEKEALMVVIDILKPESFYKEAHVRIYDCIMHLFKEGMPIDMLTVVASLRKRGELELIGGAAYIMELTSKVNSAANIEYHARIIAEAYIKRELIKTSFEISQSAYEDTSDAFDLLDKIESTVFQISQENIKKNYVTVSKGIKQSLDDMDAKKDRADGLTGVASGFSDLDKLTLGWQRQELIIIAARPACGKSSMVACAVRNAAVDFGKPVALFSLEMSTKQITDRLISSECEIELSKIRKGNLSTEEWETLHHRIKRLDAAPIFIDDSPSISILELRAKCRRLKSQHDIGLVVVDYLQLMTASTGGKSNGNQEHEVSQISRSLKVLAKELDIPVIALSQLSRSVENRGGDKRPMLSDLRSSGAIEQDADVVMFLHRPEYYGIFEDDKGNSLRGVGEVIVAKNRSGSLDTVKLKFVGKYTKFTDLESSYGEKAPTIPFTPTITLEKPIESFDITKKEMPHSTFLSDWKPDELPEPDF